ncbi:3-methyl-2-oxobutanoate hydroxymethyltransferase [Ferrimonas balearica]|uniref:3-methyl-2-oxobutanoate hydroxymethyltransferase n=1 Tax=Ferrimonas balearica TaxID=44012 RepID=UPI001C58BBBB|nr:3-methyl-2-oxobutanoate hydroxymethyltransferase [Ferrimonas balearica]MBW3139585.1 3-methyl-2-oxobutanoate hydroxymethyltransferase [Ferrimonas balearica]MBW3164623.1 3-methyl-2-oxobutanoate hydroxymethyltransferase [Ferrimonas balearica]MBY6107295.1 3-methyl-2-oxobutanoate hydroxymethyltransferase [Ferrimonas balearica]
MDRITTSTLNRYKREGRKFAALTAYDASFAAAFAGQGVPVLLIGDSLGMVLNGDEDTLKVTVEDVAYHTRAVSKGAPKALVIADMPFMSYATPEQAFDSAATLMRAGAQMVKLEGGDWLLDTVRGLTQRSVPVCAHLGLTPQSVHVFGGFKVQGRGDDAGKAILDQALRLQDAGAAMLVLECVPTELARTVTEALSIPVIGIGAGPHTDGQILVMHDLFGITSGYIPKFAKNYLAQTNSLQAAVAAFVEEVEHGRFPGPEHCFN